LSPPVETSATFERSDVLSSQGGEIGAFVFHPDLKEAMDERKREKERERERERDIG